MAMQSRSCSSASAGPSVSTTTSPPPRCLDDPHGFLDGALLVRRDGEAEVQRADLLRVVGEHDLPAGDRDALDADEDLHERILALSGSKIGVEPTMSTVTGYSSRMYSTASFAPTCACSGGRYAMRMCLPIDGPAPALVT